MFRGEAEAAALRAAALGTGNTNAFDTGKLTVIPQLDATTVALYKGNINLGVVIGPLISRTVHKYSPWKKTGKSSERR